MNGFRLWKLKLLTILRAKRLFSPFMVAGSRKVQAKSL